MLQMDPAHYVIFFMFIAASLIAIATKHWPVIVSLALLSVGAAMLSESLFAKQPIAIEYTVEQITPGYCQYDNEKRLLIIRTDRGDYTIDRSLIADAIKLNDGVAIICKSESIKVWTLEPPPGPKRIHGLETPGLNIPLTINDLSFLIYAGIFLIVIGIPLFVLTLLFGKSVLDVISVGF